MQMMNESSSRLVTSTDGGRQLTDQTVKLLMDHISSANAKVGEKLPPEAELVAQFGVSRTVVREALRELRALGIITLQQGRPTVISDPSAGPLKHYFRFAVNTRSAGLREGFELRRSVEIEAAQLAAARATEETLEELDDVIASMKNTVNHEAGWVQDDFRFHVVIAKATGNQLIENFVWALSDVIQTGIRTLYERHDLLNVERTYERHAKLCEAIKSRSPGKARSAMIDHFEATEAKVFFVEQSD